MNTGFNGTNWFEASTDFSDMMIAGAVAPNDFTLRFRADKPETFEILMNEANALIELKQKFDYAEKQLNVIYTAGLDTFTVEQNIAVLNILKDEVNIIAVQADNEYYNKQKANFDFDEYKAKFLPLRDAVAILMPYTPFIIFLAPRPTSGLVEGASNKHEQWNNKAKEYIANAPAKDSICIHIYPDGREMPSTADMPVKRVIDKVSNYFDEELNSKYKSIAQEAMTTDHFDKILIYLETYFPGKPVYVTEFGIASPGSFKNTIGYSQGIFSFWLRYRTKFEALLEHNGVSLSIAGCMSPATKKDDYRFPEESTVPRLSFFTYELVSSIPELHQNIEDVSMITEEGDYYLTFINTQGSAITSTVTVDTTLDIIDTYGETLMGLSSYSSSGDAPFKSGGSTPDFEIDGVTIIIPEVKPVIAGEEITLHIPPYSYGFLYVETKLIEEEPEPEPKPRWCKYFKWLFKDKCK
jgi:hypothetical protein